MRRQISSEQPTTPGEAPTPVDDDDADYTGTELRVSWGKEHFQPFKYQGFDCGPFEIVVTVREGETLDDARRRASRRLERMAQEEFEEKLPQFHKRCRQAGEIR